MVDHTSLPDSSTVIRPKYPTLWRLLRHQLHATCLVLTFLIYGCLATVVFCCTTDTRRRRPDFPDQTIRGNLHPARRHITSNGDDVGLMEPSTYDDVMNPEMDSKACRQVYVYTLGAFVTVVYLVYLVECWHCRPVNRGDHVDVQTVYSIAEALRQSSPLVWWSAVSYHYMPRRSHVTRLRHGRAQSSTHVQCQRIVTQRTTSGFDFTASGVHDASYDIVDLDRFPVIRFAISRHFSFSSELARRDFFEQRDEFCRAHESRDDYVDFRQGLSLVPNTNIGGSFRSQLLVVKDVEAEPWFLSTSAYWVMSLLSLSWLMRLLIGRRIAVLEYRIHKVFGHNYDNTSSTPLPPFQLPINEDLVDYIENDDDVQLLRSPESTSTLDSCDDVTGKSLTASCRRIIVPSYSQALLMDCWSRDVGNVADGVKRVRPSVSFTFGRFRSSRYGNHVRATDVINKSQSFAGHRLLTSDTEAQPRYIAYRHPGTRRSVGDLASFAMTSSASRDGGQSPPPSYSSALAMQVATPSECLQRRGVFIQRHRVTDASVTPRSDSSRSAQYGAVSATPAMTSCAVTSSSVVTILETCL